MNRPTFANNEIYHVYNRGTDKRKIFLNDGDYFRFVHNLFEFNDVSPALNIYYKKQSYEVGLRKIKNENKPRKLLVKILAFCLMPNHFHLLLEQIKDNGITEFMRKLGTGYTNYFNKKHERSGVLFQGKFKAILLENDKHLLHLPYYIHLNSLDLIFPEWRNRELKNYKKAVDFLENYRWSSHMDYINKKNFPSVTQRDFLIKFFGGQNEYKKSLNQWLRELNMEDIRDVVIENL